MDRQLIFHLKLLGYSSKNVKDIRFFFPSLPQPPPPPPPPPPLPFFLIDWWNKNFIMKKEYIKSHLHEEGEWPFKLEKKEVHK